MLSWVKMILEKNIKKRINSILFWFHSGVIVFCLFLGLFVSLQILLFIISVHRIHFFVFNGCIISKLHHRLNGFPEDMSFLQFAFFKFSGKRISKEQGHVLDFVLVFLSIGIAIIFY